MLTELTEVQRRILEDFKALDETRREALSDEAARLLEEQAAS